MPERYERRGEQPGPGRESRAKRTIFRRTVFLMVMCGVMLFVPLFWQLWNVAIVRHEDYQQRATGQQTLDLSVSASRGNIYDRKGNVLAMSATVYTLVLSPKDMVQELVPEKEYTDEEGKLDQDAWEAAVAAQQDQLMPDLMALVPGLDQERLDSQVRATQYSYREVKTKIEEGGRGHPRLHRGEQDLPLPVSGGGDQAVLPLLQPGGPGPGLCQRGGRAPTALRRCTTTCWRAPPAGWSPPAPAPGSQMYNSYSEFMDAIDGYDLTLTIDATIQSYRGEGPGGGHRGV